MKHQQHRHKHMYPHPVYSYQHLIQDQEHPRIAEQTAFFCIKLYKKKVENKTVMTAHLCLHRKFAIKI